MAAATRLTTEGARSGRGVAGSVAAMRQVLSWRLLAAIGALVALALLVNFAFAGRDSIAEIVEPGSPTARLADVIALVLDTQGQGFFVGPDGRSVGQVSMSLAPPFDKTVRIFPGTLRHEHLPRPRRVRAVRPARRVARRHHRRVRPRADGSRVHVRAAGHRGARRRLGPPGRRVAGAVRQRDRPLRVRIAGRVVLRVPALRRPRPPAVYSIGEAVITSVVCDPAAPEG